MAVVFLGVGSNLGDRQENIRLAIELLKENQIAVEKVSTVIETDPVGGPPQGKYLNACLQCQTQHSPHILLSILQSIEQKLGRTRTIKDAPRTIDLDILLYDQLTIATPELSIPHPRMWEREFVMKPLQEIAPQIVKEYEP